MVKSVHWWLIAVERRLRKLTSYKRIQWIQLLATLSGGRRQIHRSKIQRKREGKTTPRTVKDATDKTSHLSAPPGSWQLSTKPSTKLPYRSLHELESLCKTCIQRGNRISAAVWIQFSQPKISKRHLYEMKLRCGCFVAYTYKKFRRSVPAIDCKTDYFCLNESRTRSPLSP